MTPPKLKIYLWRPSNALKIPVTNLREAVAVHIRQSVEDKRQLNRLEYLELKRLWDRIYGDREWYTKRSMRGHLKSLC